MVDDYVLLAASPYCILAVIGIRALISESESDETDDDIVCLHHGGIILYADAVARSRLSGNGQVAVSDPELRGQFYDAGHIKHDNPRPARLDGSTQGTGAAVIEVGHMDYPASPAAGGVHSAAFCPRESKGSPMLILSRRNLHLGIETVPVRVIGIRSEPPACRHRFGRSERGIVHTGNGPYHAGIRHS